MATGRKTGGRKKGSLNKTPLLISEICAQECFDPVRFAIRVAKNPKVAIETRLRASEGLYPYLYSKMANPLDGVVQGTTFQLVLLDASKPAPLELPPASQAVEITLDE